MNTRRALLVGLGVGLMAGSALLQLMNYGQDLSEGTTMPVELTVDQLQKQAEGKGFAMYKLSEPMYTQAQLDAAAAKAKEDALAAAAAKSGQATGDTPAPSSVSSPSSTPAPSASASPAPAETAPAVKERLGLYVAAGDSLEKVATGLKALGVIRDKAAFIKAAKPYSGKMRVGLSVFEGQATYDEIVAELLRDKNK
ncbi:endolytic transglycosylase MltG [Cohnella sp. GbtcB17]|uniref:endolytic transglycosylase MltG n=1 Tax=Cohnella sp. GbtcB17 TaxID=2824762 RepID=UPI001C30ACF1|nr:endolytic transglycosylase MltG [Cohnella sp. GbtcB17]